MNPKIAMAAQLTRANAINQTMGAARLAGIGALGFGGGVLAGGLFGNEQQAQAPQQSFVMNPVPASASQAMPQMAISPLNEEQISKAKKRAEEQAALNAYQAYTLGQYNQITQGGQY